MIKKFLLVMMFAILLGGCGKSSDNARTTNNANTTNVGNRSVSGVARKGAKMPDFSLKTIDGDVVKISDLRGKAVIIDLWATWCAPCRREIPGFINIVKKYPADDVAIIGISMDNRISPSQLKGFAQQMGMNYPVAMLMENQSILSIFADVRSIPTTYIVDTEGNIVDRVVGMAPQSYFENRIQSILKNRSAKQGV